MREPQIVYPIVMPLIACGINHKTTALALREQAAFSNEKASMMLDALIRTGAANEAMILSTCNRTEIYTHSIDLHQLTNCIAQHSPLQKIIQTPHWYCYQDHQAVNHLMRVASGVDSMVVGEAQIVGQLKDAFRLAQKSGAIGSYLQRLLQRVFAVTKQVRTHSGIGAAPVSLAYVAVNLAKKIFADLAKSQVLLIGSGQTMELTAIHLADNGVKRLVIANRTYEKAQKLAHSFNGHAINLNDIPLYLPQVDIVVAATRSYSPVLNKASVKQALSARQRRKPLLMIDLGVPRDIAADVVDLEDVYLYNVDQLGTIITENLKSRRHAADYAEDMISVQSRFFMRQLQALDAVETICSYREKIDQLRDTALHKALDELGKGKPPAVILTEFAQQMANKIMHEPTLQLRQAAFDGNMDVLTAARKLFDL